LNQEQSTEVLKAAVSDSLATMYTRQSDAVQTQSSGTLVSDTGCPWSNFARFIVFSEIS